MLFLRRTQIWDTSTVEGLVFASGALSTVTRDLRCFRLHAEATIPSEAMSFGAIFATFHFDEITSQLAPKRRAVGDSSGDLVMYYPQSLSGAATEFTSMDPLATDPGPLLQVHDPVPPTWENCPDDITVMAELYQEAAEVIWEEPRPEDNVGIARTDLWPTYNRFSISGSPHTVSYRAWDEAGLLATCSFTVTVE